MAWTNVDNFTVSGKALFCITSLTIIRVIQIYKHHVGVSKWKQFPRYWPFVRGIRRSPVNSPHTGQWRGALMFSLICAWMGEWVNNREAGDLRLNCAHHDVTIMIPRIWSKLDQNKGCNIGSELHQCINGFEISQKLALNDIWPSGNKCDSGPVGKEACAQPKRDGITL